MALSTGTLWARQRVLSFMGSSIVITRQGSTIYSGRCSFKAAEANQGQLSEPDPVEADAGSYQSYDIWVPWGSGPFLEGDPATITDGSTTIALTLTAVESFSTHKTAIQLRAVRQRTSSELLDLVLFRTDYDSGVKTAIAAQKCQVVLAGSKAINAGTQVSGGSQAYIQGALIFQSRTANVSAGDTFRYNGRWGEVTGVPTVAPDRLEVAMRIPGGGFD